MNISSKIGNLIDFIFITGFFSSPLLDGLGRQIQKGFYVEFHIPLVTTYDIHGLHWGGDDIYFYSRVHTEYIIQRTKYV